MSNANKANGSKAKATAKTPRVTIPPATGEPAPPGATVANAMDKA